MMVSTDPNLNKGPLMPTKKNRDYAPRPIVTSLNNAMNHGANYGVAPMEVTSLAKALSVEGKGKGSYSMDKGGRNGKAKVDLGSVE
jgi:hypothetical protein